MKREVNLLVEADVTPWKDVELEGKLLVLKDKYFKEEFRDAKYQLVLATGGFGCRPDARGNAIFVRECHNDNPETYRIERCNNDILGIATDDAIAEWKAIYGEFNEEVQKMLGGNKMDNKTTDENFLDDEEKMYDFVRLTKEEFLFTYSYLTEKEYDDTLKAYKERK